jgi:hypothetical protein
MGAPIVKGAGTTYEEAIAAAFHELEKTGYVGSAIVAEHQVERVEVPGYPTHKRLWHTVILYGVGSEPSAAGPQGEQGSV